MSDLAKQQFDKWLHEIVAESTDGQRIQRRDCMTADQECMVFEGWKASRECLVIELPKKQEAWDGEGRPPIGIECEVKFNDVWSICKTLAYHQVSDTAVAVHFLNGSNALLWCATFRPIKTAEQLAEEERKSQLEVMHKIYMDGASEHKGGLAALYDAGYKLAK